MLLTTSCSNCSRRDVEFYCEECLRSRTADPLNNDAVLAVLNTCFQSSLFCGMCKELHGKIKATKTHNIKSLCPSIVTCFNCEDSDSKILCFDCIDIASWAKERKERIFDGDLNARNQMHFLSTISFCDSCYSLHLKVKSCRNHANKLPIKFAGLLESSLGHVYPAVYSGSSSLHQFFDFCESFLGRLPSHFNNLSFMQEGVLQVLWGMFEQLYDDMMEGSYSEVRYWRSMVTMLTICLIFNVICKRIFASASSGVAVVMVLVLLYVSRNRPVFNERTTTTSSGSSIGGSGSSRNNRSSNGSNTFRSNKKVLKKQNEFHSAIQPPLNKSMNIDVSDTVSLSTASDRPVSLEEMEFPGEFWYPLEGKPAHFKPRCRPYAGRAKKRNKDEVSPTEQNID